LLGIANGEIAKVTDENKFSLSGTTLTFEATDFEARDDKTYSVEIAANRAGINGGVELATIGKNDLSIDKEGIVDLDIGRGFIV
jgi:hypothetical protein